LLLHNFANNAAITLYLVCNFNYRLKICAQLNEPQKILRGHCFKNSMQFKELQICFHFFR